MRQCFYASLCHQGLRGGAIFVDDNSITYQNQTLTIPEAYKNIEIPFQEIRKIEKGRVLLLPAVTVCLHDRKYRFVIFGRKKFLTILEKAQKQNTINL